MTIRRPVAVERGRGTTEVVVVIDVEAVAAATPGPDGRVRLALSPLHLLGLSAEVQEAQAGLVLMAMYPPAVK